MHVKRFVASSIQEAMAQIKNEMGNEAVILHTRYFKEGGVLGLFKKAYVEITAAAENTLQYANHSQTGKTIAALQPPLPAAVPSEQSEDLREMRSLMSEMSFMLEKNAILSHSSRLGSSLYRRLRKQEIDEKIAHKIVKATLQQLSLTPQSRSEEVNQLLNTNLLKPLKKGSPIIFNQTRQKRPKVYAFVGPTGVGKTTTIAKLAARFAVIEKKKVALITVDTYRIAAAEQLKTIAEIMNVPVHVVYSYNQMSNCLMDLAAYDIIFIDTAGRSHKNNEQLEELKNYLQIAGSDATFLVLTATGKCQDMLEIIDAYSELNISHLIFTKLDETSYYGSIYNIACQSEYTLSYFTNGQNIPDDIEAANPERLVQLLTKEQ